VLVVVPDDGTREDILVALAPRYRAYGARDAEEASEILAWIEPRAVLCDATSPSRLDGFALVRRLRADQPGRCAFVMLTRARCGSDMIHALQAGARCCVEVPVDLAAMGSALCRILS
jgi:DNA-binding response OmpR family regulator